MNMEELREYQLAQLELLDITDEICKTKNLTYYLIGGTLLGAIRHDGFIPWDADMDIAMPREDYEKFRDYWAKNPSERYFYQHYTTEQNHLSPHALLRIKNTHVIMNSGISKYQEQYDGIYLDIFPLDEAPSTRKEQERQMKKLKRIRRIIVLKAGYLYGAKTGFLKKIAKSLVQIGLAPFSFTCLNKKLDNAMQKYRGGNSGYWVSMASHYSYWKQLMPQEIYGQPVRVEFEGRQLCAPAQADTYLKQIYKDYMQLPPEDKRYSDLDCIQRVDYGVGESMQNDK